jgi:hypothetical protein
MAACVVAKRRQGRMVRAKNRLRMGLIRVITSKEKSLIIGRLLVTA